MGHKYDFRVYVLVTQIVSPMKVFIYKDGLVRLATQKYDFKQNLEDTFVHLTNYSLNKINKNFDSSKHKLSLRDVLKGEMVSESKGKIFRKSAETIWN